MECAVLPYCLIYRPKAESDAPKNVVHMHDAEECCAGSSGEDGRLSKQEARELKSYITKLQLFEREDVVQECLATVQKLC